MHARSVNNCMVTIDCRAVICELTANEVQVYTSNWKSYIGLRLYY